jgi:hypothetical protein
MKPVYYQNIQWGDGEKMSEVRETFDCALTEEHVREIQGLIETETVTIDMRAEDGATSYTLDAMFVLNRTVVSSFCPVSLWFPENGTRAKAELSYATYVKYTSEPWENQSIRQNCTTERSIRDGQRGFYIRIHELGWDKFRLSRDPVLNVTIEGTLDNNWFDFVIVTVPRQNSTIEMNLPAAWSVTRHSSPFQDTMHTQVSNRQSLVFFGPCLEMKTLHVEWMELPDRDGDQSPDSQDAFPDDPDEWEDTDSDGTGDNSDGDIDNDGYGNDVDVFPKDPTEWADTDGDGVGDNSDADADGDGYSNDVDRFPYDAGEWADLDGDGAGDNSDVDLDGDGVDNFNDTYPADPAEWADLDNDSIGDNTDTDIDGDGVLNDDDGFPFDPSRWRDEDKDGLEDDTEDPYPSDTDNDGYQNSEDAFPEDPKRWEDESGGPEPAIYLVLVMVFANFFLAGYILLLKGKRMRQ